MVVGCIDIEVLFRDSSVQFSTATQHMERHNTGNQTNNTVTEYITS